MKRRALLLAGGAARGAYQVGMLLELVKKYDFQILRGISVGALNAAFLAEAPTAGNSREELARKVDDLFTIWHGVRGNRSIYKKRAGWIGMFLGANSLYSLKPLRNLLDNNLHLDRIKSSGRDFAVGTVSLLDGSISYPRPSDKRFMDKLVASISIPGIFPYLDLMDEEEVLVDAGIRDTTPLGNVFRADPRPDEIYILLTSKLIRKGNDLPRSSVKKQSYRQWRDCPLTMKINGFDVMRRALDILLDEIYLGDIREAIRWNNILEPLRNTVNDVNRARNALPEEVADRIAVLSKIAEEKLNRRPVPVYVLAPRECYGDSNAFLDFDPKRIARAIEHGREIASDPRLWVWPP